MFSIRLNQYRNLPGLREDDNPTGSSSLSNLVTILFVISIKSESNRLEIQTCWNQSKENINLTLNQIEYPNIVLMPDKYVVQIFHNRVY
jgi:hypothetical protein